MKNKLMYTLTGGGGSTLSRLSELTGITLPCHAELDSASIQRCTLSVSWDRFRLVGRNDRKGFTMADRLSRLHNWLDGLRSAFTMAEILLSLTIIGVVAAITLPSLTGNINERTWSTQRKALYARFSQAIALMPALNGYGTLDDTTDTAAETFVTDGLAKVLKINNICDSEHLTDCGIPNKITTFEGTVIDNFTTTRNTLATLNNMFNGSYISPDSGVVHTYSQKDTKAAAFETQNGESIIVYYNPNCIGDLNQIDWHTAQPKVCANFIYDLNGSKGPNTAGKDIGFMSAIYPSDSVLVAPYPLLRDAGHGAHIDAVALCNKQDSESRLPTKEELISMFTNRDIIGTLGNHQYWASNMELQNGTLRAWNLTFRTGGYGTLVRTETSVSTRCVKR